MRMRLYAVVAAVLAVLAAFANMGSTANAQSLFPWNSASESYFTLHVDEGRVSVKVDAEFLNTNNAVLSEVAFWAMPGAKNAKVTNPAGDEMPIEVIEGNEATSTPSLVVVKQELKPKVRTKYTLTYDMHSQKGEYADVKAGAIEALFVSQGPGSFVYIDAPKSGDTYLDPGCLVAKDQGGVGAQGFERWICGETVLLALYGEDKSLMDRCAAADNRCRQRQFILPFSAFAQSITDQNLIGRLSETITLSEGTVELELRHFKSDEAWARDQFEVAKKAMPRLEALFGFPYPHDHAILKQSRYIGLVGAAGIAFTSTGEMLVQFGSGSDEEVLIHELAHQWAGLNLGEKWIWEGLAEWAGHVVGEEVGIPVTYERWDQLGYTDKLANWYNGSLVYDSEYWYGKGAAFFKAYEAAVGGREAMTTILGRIDDDPSLWPLSSRWFLDQGEFVSGANLDALFLEWVYPATAEAELAKRRAVHDQVNTMLARARAHGFEGMPIDLYKNLIAWSFPGIPAQVTKANEVLDRYDNVLKMAQEDGLTAGDAVAKAWGKSTIAQIGTVVDNQRQALLSMRAAKTELANQPEGAPSLAKLEEAKGLFNKGDYNGAKSAAAAGVTMIYNEAAAAHMIKLAREKQENFNAGFFAKIGMMFTNPEAKLAEAEEQYAAGNGAVALASARDAYKTWNEAGERGLKRLGMFTAAMAILCFGVWYVLRRMEGPVFSSSGKALGQGHYIDQNDKRGNWKDWENSGS